MNLIRSVIQFLTLPFVNKPKYKPGISVLVCCRDEEYSLELCLESMVDFADQVVCIDHLSEDKTYDVMISFKKRYKHLIDIEVIRCFSDNLRDARSLGLTYVNREWFLLCGGDFVFNDTTQYNAARFFNSLKKKREYAAFRFSFVNIYGDLAHTFKDEKEVFVLGENYLLRMSPFIHFREEGKFDYLYFPWFYKRLEVHEPVFFHLGGLKSDDRLIYRNCYFEWREIFNSAKSETEQKKLGNFVLFKKLWNQKLFYTNDPLLLKHRYQKQLLELHYAAYNPSEFFDYPSLLKKKIIDKEERFKILYENGRPFKRLDEFDPEMQFYQPEIEDNWSVENYNQTYVKKDYLNEIKEFLLNVE